MDLKRKGEEKEDKRPRENLLAVRILLDMTDAGVVIGKGGANIKQFREESKAHLDIGQSVQGTKERIATLRGSLEQVVQGLRWIGSQLATRKVKPGTHAVTLLVLNVHVGAVLGKGGATIKEIRTSSGADIRISKDVIEGSDEKTIKIEGPEAEFARAVEMIALHLQDSVQKAGSRASGILHQPRPLLSPMAAQLMQYPAAAAAFGAPVGYSEFGVPLGLAPLGAPPQGIGSGRESVVMQVPENLVGSVIGRGGSTINSIRQRSGANVVVDKRQSSGENRTITITGTKQQSDWAHALITNIISQARLAE
jgi:predicted RNA-binding protein YlqC (UPF0109 family)